MNSAQPESSQTKIISLPTLPASDDSDETSPEEDPLTSWNDLSIIERVGLNGLEMSENDVEAAFSQITLAFRCDQYTLKQRLQAEEHARNLAEENVQLELARGRETLELLKALCLDSRRSTILQKLELSLDILGGTVERISNTAEVLGAVHQEARASRAVELMVAHVENIRRRYERNLSELEEARRQIKLRLAQRQSLNRDSDQEENGSIKQLTKQGSLRRRVSLTIINNPTHVQEKKKRERKRGGKKQSSSCPSPCPSSESSICVLNDGCSTNDRALDPNEAEENPEQIEMMTESPPLPPAPVVSAEEPPPEPKPQDPPAATAPSKNSTFESVRQRHRGRAALSRKRSDRKGPHLHHKSSSDRCKGPGTSWMHRCRWLLLSLYLLLLLSFIITIYFLLIESY